jgi:hypothetical protein
MQLEQEVDSIAEATGFSGVVRVDRAGSCRRTGWPS